VLNNRRSIWDNAGRFLKIGRRRSSPASGRGAKTARPPSDSAALGIARQFSNDKPNVERSIRAQ
jgi:hypothetical protein